MLPKAGGCYVESEGGEKRRRPKIRRGNASFLWIAANRLRAATQKGNELPIAIAFKALEPGICDVEIRPLEGIRLRVARDPHHTAVSGSDHLPIVGAGHGIAVDSPQKMPWHG